ncbi:hypothetical protein IQ07DRAFT_640733 [Pyrenochaeta sp. DS3sAY3a]|nr:hypothetical protein IQ07DRAFT_640733 [Pyrenochaeta sp. DS3sAY3a]
MHSSTPKATPAPARSRSQSHAQREHSQSEETPQGPIPYHVSPPRTRGRSRTTRDASVHSDTHSHTSEPPFLALPLSSAPAPVPLPEHYGYAPTVPSPFEGTLEASLDAILLWGAMYADTQAVVYTLLQPVDRTTDWPGLLRGMLVNGDKPAGRGRFLLEELLFLVTRTLLPEQITENRLAMGRLYERKKQLSIRLILRYDIGLDWRRAGAMTAASLPPNKEDEVPEGIPGLNEVMFPNRRELMPNIISTLIAAPEDGWSTQGVRDRMKHHIGHLDSYLILDDEDVAEWDETRLLAKTSQILLQWQWIRSDTETLLDLEVDAWEALDKKAEECEWIADDAKRMPPHRNDKGNENIKARRVKKLS